MVWMLTSYFDKCIMVMIILMENRCKLSRNSVLYLQLCKFISKLEVCLQII